MQITIAKMAAIAIALAYAIAGAILGGMTADVFTLWIVLLLPLALIWFPEELGSMTGYVGRGGDIDTETPPILVSAAGWFFLVGLPVVLFLLS